MKKTLQHKLILLSICLLFSLNNSWVNAAAFALKEQGVTNLGNAYAGTAAEADDASTAYYNAAGLTNLPNDQLTFSLVALRGVVKFNPEIAKGNSGQDLPLIGNKNSERPIISSLFVAKKIDAKYSLGLSLASPFGLKTNYAPDSSARILARRSELRTYEFAPSLAYVLSEQNSIAIGPNLLKGKVKLDTDLVYNNPGLTGAIHNTLNGNGCGYHFSWFFKPDETLKMGLQYRSRIKVRGIGGSLSTVAAIPRNRTVTAKLILPDSLTYSIAQQFTEYLSILGDLEFTHWSLFKELRLDFSNNQSVIIPENYKNAWRLALGLNYQINQQLIWKTGVAYDQTPTRDNNRTVRIPDADRIWLSLGGKYTVNHDLTINFGYAHIFFKNVVLEEQAPLNANGVLFGQQYLKGNYKNNADVVGIQLTWNFV